VPISLSF